MDLETRIQGETFEKVTSWMDELFGIGAKRTKDVPVIRIQCGSTMTFVTVYPWGDDDTIIEVESELVRDAETTPELMSYLLSGNHRMRLGAFALDPRGKVVFRHTIVGSTCDRAELARSVRLVSHIADKFDGEIVSRWGGLMTTEP